MFQDGPLQPHRGRVGSLRDVRGHGDLDVLGGGVREVSQVSQQWVLLLRQGDAAQGQVDWDLRWRLVTFCDAILVPWCFVSLFWIIYLVFCLPSYVYTRHCNIGSYVILKSCFLTLLGTTLQRLEMGWLPSHWFSSHHTSISACYHQIMKKIYFLTWETFESTLLFHHGSLKVLSLAEFRSLYTFILSMWF